MRLMPICALLLTVILLVGSAVAGELFKVSLHNQVDADKLLATGAEALLWVPGGYLVLADAAVAERLRQSGLDLIPLAVDVTRGQLALDGRFDRLNTARFPVLYEDNQLRILLVEQGVEALAGERVEVFPLRYGPVSIQYSQPKAAAGMPAPGVPGLVELIGQIDQDSLESYVLRLEAFTHRLTGTDSNYAARDWLEAKFGEFGYDSVVIDPFTGSQLWARVPCQSYNVIAYKVGTTYPDQQVIVGGHFDAVPDCPGADDNASGTACVLEIARILHDIDLPMTFIFIAFDSEESWMWGSYHYADSAAARGDDIILMVNPDMIAHWDNDLYSNLYYGEEEAYAALWKELADSLVGIDAYMSGATASDHLPFQENGWPVIFVQERVFSTNYHLPTDSSAYLNFEYMTRMVKATLATVYTTTFCPKPVELLSVLDAGDGNALEATWETGTPGQTDHYRLYYYPVSTPSAETWVDLPSSQTTYLITGLVDGAEYAVHVVPVNAEGYESIGYNEVMATPRVVPPPTEGLAALPVNHGVRLQWSKNNTELDFDHYLIARDGQLLPGWATDTTFVDDDPAIGTDFHYYQVMAVDADGYQSDTLGLEPAYMRAADLRPNEILSVNRSYNQFSAFVNEVATGQFLRDALWGYNFTYYSDTVGIMDITEDTLGLFDIIDYGVLIIAGEGRADELTGKRLLDTLAYYLSIGGKAIVFGRWWATQVADTFYYTDPANENHAYCSYLGIESRTLTETPLIGMTMMSDFVGAGSQVTGYPELTWDSLATNAHSAPLKASGVPFASYVSLASPGPEIVYTYHSRDGLAEAEGQPVGWRNLGGDYQFVFFEFPLSFMDYATAVTALRKAAEDLGIPPPVGCCLYSRGNANGDGEDKVNISDVTYLVDFLFGIPTGPDPACWEEGNANGDGEEKVNVSDVSYLIAYLFGIPAGPPPPACPSE
ncbi:MAG: M28 family metallopeptidase [candidate division Zixibacteria bacterium]|nr:M28 family metallopeptidase [candidate division Zixibacteria bacterium]